MPLVFCKNASKIFRLFSSAFLKKQPATHFLWRKKRCGWRKNGCYTSVGKENSGAVKRFTIKVFSRRGFRLAFVKEEKTSKEPLWQTSYIRGVNDSDSKAIVRRVKSAIVASRKKNLRKFSFSKSRACGVSVRCIYSQFVLQE